MGNYGTTPSWDDEQIARYGLFPHLNMISSRFRAEFERRRIELVEKHIEAVLLLLPENTEETRVRVARAMPRTFSALDLGDKAIDFWKKFVATDLYDDYCIRTGQKLRTPFPDLSEGEQKPFFDIIEAISEVWRKNQVIKPSLA